MIEFVDITTWVKKVFFQSGGTRSKVVVEQPNQKDLYYFKTSLQRRDDLYKNEFWSEIIASAIGKFLGFDTLAYHIACNENKIGCLSKSIFDVNTDSFFHLMDVLVDTDRSYAPRSKVSYDSYTFQFIEQALIEHNLTNFIPDIVKTIIFDCLVGNSDRHQENIAFIVPNHKSDNVTELVQNLKQDGGLLGKKTILSPIYDSGSCLGRELTEAKVTSILTNRQEFDAYIRRGVCEIRCETGMRISPFDLLPCIAESNELYREIIQRTINQTQTVFDEERIKEIIEQIDLALPAKYCYCALSPERKRLMLRLIVERFERLGGAFYENIQ
jgi:hypothetical protein